MTEPSIEAGANAEPEPCEYCGAKDWNITATLIGCHGCGVVYGRVNGAWVLDPDTVPRGAREMAGFVRRLDIGRGFVRARECPDCFHTKCGESCVCNCDAAHAEAAAHLRGQVENLESLTTWRPISEPPSAEVHAWCGGHYLIRYPDGAWRVVQFSTVRALVAFAKRYIGGERFRWLPIPPADESEGE